MIDLGSGIALAGFFVSGGAVAITVIRTFYNGSKNGKDEKNSFNTAFPCKEHSGIVAGLGSIKETTDRQEKWLSEISRDVKVLLRK